VGWPVPVRGISRVPPFSKGGQGGFADQLDAILSDTAEIARMRAASRERHAAMFTWERVLGECEGLLGRWQAG
jgi:glycosyltransferase involved in cell wall biosynthesis